jgi:glycosyltransferase involved in cell wall biosynthesis
VPFYNVEPYIEDCIRSLYDQDIPMEEYEVICVDDCSPDGSREIVERLQKEYPTLRMLIHTENKRQGGARNTGLREAKGKYVWFVDSDDYIKPNCLKGLLEQAESEDLDILDFDFETESEKQTFTKNTRSFEMGSCAPTDYIFSDTYGGKSGWRCTSVCAGLYKRDLIVNNHLSFCENVQWEDDDFAIELYAYAKSLHHLPEKPYIYRYTLESTVVTKTTLVQVRYMTLLAVRLAKLFETIKSDVRWQGLLHEAVEYYAGEILRAMKDNKMSDVRSFYRQYSEELKTISEFVGKKKRLALMCYWLLPLVKQY